MFNEENVDTEDKFNVLPFFSLLCARRRRVENVCENDKSSFSSSSFSENGAINDDDEEVLFLRCNS